jgi:DNA-directed RNA polymerase subunit RPC12/RpoP
MQNSDDVEFGTSDSMQQSTNSTKHVDANNYSTSWQDQDSDMISTEKNVIPSTHVQENQWISSSLKCVLTSINDTSFCPQNSDDQRRGWESPEMQNSIKNNKQSVNVLQSDAIGQQNVDKMQCNSKKDSCGNEVPELISQDNIKDNEAKLSNPSSIKIGVNNDFNKAYECEVCFKRFTTKYFHKKHQRLHTGERPYTCGTCGKTFAFQQSFHKHLLYHTSAKPHSCAECGQAFKELSTLHNHQRIHTGERPFVCETCGKCQFHIYQISKLNYLYWKNFYSSFRTQLAPLH